MTFRDVRYLMNSGKYVEVIGGKKRQMSQAEAQDFETFSGELNKKRSMTNDSNMLLQLVRPHRSTAGNDSGAATKGAHPLDCRYPRRPPHPKNTPRHHVLRSRDNSSPSKPWPRSYGWPSLLLPNYQKPKNRKSRDNTAPTANNRGHCAASTPGLRSSEGVVTRPGSSPPACALVHEVRDPAPPRDPEPLGVVANHFGEDIVAPRTPPLLEEPVPACPSPSQSIDGGDSLRPQGGSP